jgi:GNAT superfamily N-acetyltransferase
MSVPDATRSVDFKIREATRADLGAIMKHRRRMYEDMGYNDESALKAMESTSSSFIKDGLEDGTYRGWLVEVSGRIVAGGGLMIVRQPSSPRDPSSRRSWIMNMYTDPEYRWKGLSTSIIQTIIAGCRENGYHWVSLRASDAGRHLYETLGFKPTNEMRLMLK